MKTIVLAAIIPGVMLAACGRDPAPTTVPPAPAPISATGLPAPEATAMLAGTSGSSVGGEIQLSSTENGVLLTGNVTGLEPNTSHGFHVHETGDCSAPDGTSAGGHFNPEDKMHGNAAAGEHHVGDMPNLVAGPTGVATVSATVLGATLGDGGPHDLMGKAVIVHADADDYTSQPSGNAGKRVACAVISSAM